MSEKLILASCTCDVILYVDHLPLSCQDVKVKKRETKIGGCGYHVAKACEQSILACPCGTGIYGDFVKQALLQEDISFYCPQVLEENGVCFCLIEPNGERTFMASHGAEYHFSPEILEDLPETEWVYVSGIDLEEKQNHCVIEYLKNKKRKVFFSPGPRVDQIPAVLEEMLTLHPVLHMNKEECEAWTGQEFKKGMEMLWQKTGQPVIVTDASRGSYAYDQKLVHVAVQPVRSENVTGAGDTHAGSCLDSLSQGMDLETMLEKANQKAKEKIVKKEGIR